MRKLKLVVVGPGLIGKKHMALIKARSDASLVAVVAPDRPGNREIAERHRVTFHESLQACLDLEAPDGVIIASPNEFHAQQARMCIDRDVAVLIEKPITSNAREALELAELAESRQGRVMVGHHRAHSPIMKTARAIVGSGRLGQLVTVSGSAQFIKPSQYFLDGPWRTRPGGGPILINLIHEIGNLRALCGEILEVQAMSSSKTRGFQVEDTVAINLQFASGVLGTFMLSDCSASTRSWEQTSGENPAYPRDPAEDCYMVSGTRGSLAIPSMKLRYFPSDVEPSWWTAWAEAVVTVSPGNPLAHQLSNFIDVIRDKAAPVVSARDGLQNLLVTEAIHLSAVTRRSISINALRDGSRATHNAALAAIRLSTFAGEEWVHDNN
jgi:predicted dehydrogenase